MKVIVIFLSIYLLMCSFGSYAYCGEYKAWISTKLKDSILEIKAFCQSSEDGHVKYKLEAKKSGKAGRTRSTQSGLKYLRAQEETSLSKLSLKVSPKDEYEIILEVYKDGKLIAEDSVIYPNVNSLY